MYKAQKKVGKVTRAVGTGLRKEAPKVAAGAAVVEKLAPLAGKRGKVIGKAAKAVRKGATVAARVGAAEQKDRKAKRTVTRKKK